MNSEPAPSGASAHSTIVRGAAALASGEVVARTIAFVATTLLARRLGPDGFGILGFAAALCGYLLIGVNSGLHDIGTREVARAPERAVTIYSSVATVRLLLAVVAFLVLAGVAWALPKPMATKLVVLLTGLSFFSFALDPSWVFRGLERPALASIGQVVAQIIYAAGAVLVIRSVSDVSTVPIIQFAGELVAAALLCAVLFRNGIPTLTLAAGVSVLRGAAHLTLARALRMITISFDMVLLGFLATDRDVGLYNAAYRLTFLVISFAGAIAAAYLPSYARVVFGPTDRIRSLVDASMGLATTVGAPLVVGVIVTAAPLLTLLFGAPYAAGAPALQLLALSVGVVFLHAIVGNVILAQHRTRLQAAINGAAAVVNIGLNVVLIPRFGIAGAAAATLISELTVGVCGLVVLIRMDVRPSLRVFVRPMVAAGIMGIVVWAAGSLPVLLRIVIGGSVYTIMLASLGGIPTRVVREAIQGLWD